MRTLLIDEILLTDIERLEAWLCEQNLQSALKHLYHFTLPPELLTALQQEHAKTCGPYYMAVEIRDEEIRLEFLVRGKKVLHCPCLAYASSEQEAYMVHYLENLLQQLGIVF